MLGFPAARAAGLEQTSADNRILANRFRSFKLQGKFLRIILTV
jgi:hypothetical protein